MKLIRTEDAVGQVLCHDMTQIIPGSYKDARFRKGHVVTEEDIPVLLSIGKEHLYIFEMDEGMLHEDEAADILRKISQGPHMKATAPKEGKISLQAECLSVLKIRREALYAVNSLGEMMIASKRADTLIKKEQVFAGMRVIPLVIEKEKMEKAREAAGPEPIFQLLPLKEKRAAVLATGSEILKGRIEDRFTPVVEEKITSLGSLVTEKQVLDDDAEVTTRTVLSAIERGAELVCVTGGMSVDPDDRTPLAIRNTGARIISYGAPVLPGAMFLLAYYVKGADAAALTEDEIAARLREDPASVVPIAGLPGCVMYANRTVFDLVLPRLLADDPVRVSELCALGEGGLL